MFEAAELGHKLDKKAFKEIEPALRTQLLNVQDELREARVPVIIIVSGVEGAGKGSVVNRLHEWLDSRGLQTHAFWDETDEERLRPRYWRFWRTMPPRGSISILFGSWYTAPIIDRVFDRSTDAELDAEAGRIKHLERLLSADGALIVKLWFHLSKDEQRKRLKEDAKTRGTAVPPEAAKFSKRYDRFARVSERVLRQTDTGTAPWHIIEATDDRYRDVTTGRILLEACRNRLGRPVADTEAPAVSHTPLEMANDATVLDALDLARRLGEKTYKKQLADYQRHLNDLTWEARRQGRSTVMVFEGWDAAGKGGAIRRLTAAMDARLYRVIPIAAPTDEEFAHHYLWRFWRHLPMDGRVTIFDRSWYGRVLVERVEGFAREEEWRRAYHEITGFEEQLAHHGSVVLKFWLHIDPDEQLRRFKEREKIAYKQYKITDEDWRNRERWNDYKLAVNEMVVRTSTAFAPWHLIPANDKKLARIEVLKTVCAALTDALRKKK